MTLIKMFMFSGKSFFLMLPTGHQLNTKDLKDISDHVMSPPERRSYNYGEVCWDDFVVLPPFHHLLQVGQQTNQSLPRYQHSVRCTGVRLLYLLNFVRKETERNPLTTCFVLCWRSAASVWSRRASETNKMTLHGISGSLSSLRGARRNEENIVEIPEKQLYDSCQLVDTGSCVKFLQLVFLDGKSEVFSSVCVCCREVTWVPGCPPCCRSACRVPPSRCASLALYSCQQRLMVNFILG